MQSAPSNNLRPRASVFPTRARADVGFGAARGRRGFTLLEVVVVMVVMTTVAGIGILRYSRSNSRYRVEAACARLAADLRLAQVQARTSSTARVIRFSGTSPVYTIMNEDEVSANSGGLKMNLAAEPYRVSMRVDGIPGYEIKFNGRGEGNRGGIIVFTNGGVEGAVIIEPNIGRAYVVRR